MSFPHDEEDCFNLTDKQAKAAIEKLLDGIKTAAHNSSVNPQEMLWFLMQVIERAGYDDFFGTEGWRVNILG